MPITARRLSRAHIIPSSPRSHYSESETQAPCEFTEPPDLEAWPSSRLGASTTSNNLSYTPSRRVSRPNHVVAKQRGLDHHHDYDLHAGAEPGINPLSRSAIAEYSHFKQDCVIDVVDYDCDDITFRRLTNEGLVDLLAQPGVQDSTADDDDATLPPRMVRWINIGGVDWSVLSALAVKYHLHSLALEDILHERGHNHSKADYYPGHLFIRVLSHSLQLEDVDKYYDDPDPSQLPRQGGNPAAPSPNVPVANLDLEGGAHVVFSRGQNEGSKYIPTLLAQTPDSSPSPASIKITGPPEIHFANTMFTPIIRKRFTGLSGFGGEAREHKKREIEALKKGDHIAIRHEPMFIFLLPNGTVISIHTSPDLDFTSPIAERLHRPDSILRVSEDASLLVEGLLDLIVDRVLEVIDEYQVKINQLEHDILLNPVMHSVRSLHILSGDMIMHKRTLDPIRTMVFGLRYYDVQRSQAMADSMARERLMKLDPDTETDIDKDGDSDTKDKDKDPDQRSEDKATRRREKKRAALRAERSPAFNQPRTRMSYDSSEFGPGNGMRPEGTPTDRQQVHGYFSFKAKVYLADVSDHMDFAITSLEMFAGISENLLNYAFNIASYDMNVIMNRLTTTTIIFLPLTLLTGYFGMNFTIFWSIQGHSDLFFWKIAIPSMAVLISILMYRDIRQLYAYLKRRAETRRITADLKVRSL